MRHVPLLLMILGLAACGGQQEEEDIQLPVPEANPYPFEGLWAKSPNTCEQDLAVDERSPMRLTAYDMIAFDHGCPIDRVVTITGDERFEAVLNCKENEAGKAPSYYLRLSGQTLMVEDEEGTSYTWFKCEPGVVTETPAE